MKFDKPLKRVRLLRRYKRFLADVYSKEMDLEFTVHCPNSGSMKGIFEDGTQPMAWVSESSVSTRKLPFTLEMIETSHGLVGVNTRHPNDLVEEALRNGHIESLLGYNFIKREASIGQSRIDFLLESVEKPRTYVEVKNVSMRVNDYASFPDAVTSRGTKHLLELMHRVHQGERGVMLYICQRMDCSVLKTADFIDPLYGETLRKVMSSGVEVLAYRCHVSPEEITIHDQMELHL